MDDQGKLARRQNGNSESLPELSPLEQLLVQLQLRYRTEMGPLERSDWLNTLNPYSIEEVLAAANELTLNPPDDWTGLPKLPDLLRVIHRTRDAAAEERRRKEGDRLLAELRDLERRKAAGEEFFTLADVLKHAPKNAAAKAMPSAKPEFPDINPEANKAKLEQQKRELLK